MTSPSLSQIEQFISLLSYEEQLWLVERIIHNLRLTPSSDNLRTQPQTFEQELSLMANDPAIQEELKAIEQEFAIIETVTRYCLGL
jgi:hypothetical protein